MFWFSYADSYTPPCTLHAGLRVVVVESRLLEIQQAGAGYHRCVSGAGAVLYPAPDAQYSPLPHAIRWVTRLSFVAVREHQREGGQPGCIIVA